VKIIEGKHLLALDSGGTSDPYCIVAVGEQSLKTRTIKKTLNPVWGETFPFQIDKDVPKIISLTCMDWDKLSEDDLIGIATIDFSDLEDDGTRKDVWVALGRDHSNDGSKRGKHSKHEPVENEQLGEIHLELSFYNSHD